jgi:hypothetical protein
MLTSLMLSSMLSITSVSPVALAACHVFPPVIQQQGDSAAPSGSPTLHVRFSNAARQTISRVTFTLSDGTQIIDAGTFTPGVTIDHTFGLTSTDAASCAVTAVEFQDGSTWDVNSSAM